MFAKSWPLPPVESRNCPRNRKHGRPRDASENHSRMDGASEGQATDSIRPRPSPKGPSSRTSFSAAAASRTTESWDGCCRASAGRDRCRPGSRETTPAASFYRTPPSRPRASPCNHVATEPRADLSGRRTTEVLLQMAQVWQRLAETTRAAARPYPADWVVATKSGWQRATPGSFYSRPGADPHPLAQSRGFLTT